MEARDPLLSVVLCTRNGAATILDQLDALAGQETTIDWELIVVDNASTDNTIDIVRERWSSPVPLRVVSAAERRGLPHARNRGVAEARAERVAFCDDDDVVGERWVDEMARALGAHRLVAPAFEYERLNSPERLAGRSRFQSSGVESLLGLPVCSGACGVRRSLWVELGGNDEDLDATGEDFDFALRAARVAGVRPHFEPRAIYHCRLRTTDRETFGQAHAYGRSHAMLWARYGDSRFAPRADRKRARVEWWWLLTRAPAAAVGRNRAIWARVAGRRLGRLAGSLSEGVWVP